ncbi:hypothetical protein XCR_4383 [Xanthomonas campestris pv. raphani 756C]|nr:hypothetical protein XCR_4383 [Xanthomonas campestris pv. raphani 756C]
MTRCVAEKNAPFAEHAARVRCYRVTALPRYRVARCGVHVA